MKTFSNEHSGHHIFQGDLSTSSEGRTLWDKASLVMKYITGGVAKVLATTTDVATSSAAAQAAAIASANATAAGYDVVVNDRITANMFIKGVGVSIGCVANNNGQYYLPNDANQVPANIEIPNIVPANCRVLDVFLICSEAAVFSGGPSTLVAGIGSASAGTQYAGSATIYALNAINGQTTKNFPSVAISHSASSIWITDITPGANWDTITAGQWLVYITYIDTSMINILV